MKILQRVKAWFLSIRWWVWAILCLLGIGLLVMIKIWDRFMSNKTAKGLDKGLVEIGNKMAVVQAQAIEQKAIVKAKTEAQVKEIRAAASVEDPQERRRKLAEFLNSLDTTR